MRITTHLILIGAALCTVSVRGVDGPSDTRRASQKQPKDVPNHFLTVGPINMRDLLDKEFHGQPGPIPKQFSDKFPRAFKRLDLFVLDDAPFFKRKQPLQPKLVATPSWRAEAADDATLYFVDRAELSDVTVIEKSTTDSAAVGRAAKLSIRLAIHHDGKLNLFEFDVRIRWMFDGSFEIISPRR